MTKWIKCSDKLPKSKRDPRIIYCEDEIYRIIILINKELFIACARSFYTVFIHLSEDIFFDLERNKWVMPPHYREPDHWMEIPGLPND